MHLTAAITTVAIVLALSQICQAAPSMSPRARNCGNYYELISLGNGNYIDNGQGDTGSVRGMFIPTTNLNVSQAGKFTFYNCSSPFTVMRSVKPRPICARTHPDDVE